MGQVGTLLIHRLTHNDEIRAIQNHLDDYSIKQVKKLNQGEAILTSINLLQNLFIRVTKCKRRQDNDTPSNDGGVFSIPKTKILKTEMLQVF